MGTEIKDPTAKAAQREPKSEALRAAKAAQRESESEAERVRQMVQQVMDRVLSELDAHSIGEGRHIQGKSISKVRILLPEIVGRITKDVYKLS